MESDLPLKKGKGIAGTVIFHAALLFALITFAFAPPKPPEQDLGIMVNFGTDEVGTGLIEPSPPPSRVEAVPPPKRSVKSQEEAPMLSQNDEEAPRVKKVDPVVEKKKLEKIEADRKIREQLEADRKVREQEELERKRAEAEQKRESDIINRTKNALAGSKASGTDSKGEGEGGGLGNQGVPTGSVDSKVRGPGGGTGTSGNAISFNLQGRGFRALPAPKYDYQEEGVVVVEVSVDRSGNVIQANPGTKGSTTLNEYLLKVAKEAAMKARFDPKPDAPVVQKGTIIYRFILR